MTCPNTKIEIKCTCPKNDCPRHGICCECVAFHRDTKKNAPNCFKGIL
jgi:hypothetical protein